jgi:Ni,Fe-hydrogenase III component G
MTDSELIANLERELPGKILEAKNPEPRRIFATVAPSDFLDCLRHLRDRYGFTHVSTVSGVDAGDSFEVIYHLAVKTTTLHLRLRFPRSDPRYPSASGVLPGAILYEREIQDMFGITVDGIPDPRPLVLPDDWPAANYPLRKDWSFDRPAEVIPGGKK